MKAKLIQIALGAVGSIVAVLVQHYAGAGPDVTTALVGGALTNAALGGLVHGTVS